MAATGCSSRQGRGGMRFGSRAGAWFDRLIRALSVAASVILAFLILAVCWDVVARTLFGRPLAWVLEFTEYGLLYMTFLSTAWVLKKEGHVTSDLLLSTLGPGTQAGLNMATSLMGAAVCVLLAVFGALVSWEKLQSGAFQPTAIQPPDFPIFVVIPVGSLLLAIQFLRRARRWARSWSELRRPGAPTPPVSGGAGR